MLCALPLFRAFEMRLPPGSALFKTPRALLAPLLCSPVSKHSSPAQAAIYSSSALADSSSPCI